MHVASEARHATVSRQHCQHAGIVHGFVPPTTTANEGLRAFYCPVLPAVYYLKYSAIINFKSLL